MVTSFNRKDLASFGNYLLSDARKATFEGWDDLNSNFDDALLAEVRPEDFYNWMDIQEKTFIDTDNLEKEKAPKVGQLCCFDDYYEMHNVGVSLREIKERLGMTEDI